jgi:translation initiation factor 4A
MATNQQPTVSPDNEVVSPDDIPRSEAKYIVHTYDSFDDMDIPESTLRGVYSHGFENPSAIQSKAIVPIISGRDVIGQAQSGTGKTGTFAIGTLSRIDTTSVTNQIVVLAPTHELATQIGRVYKGISQFMTNTDVQIHVGGSSTREAMDQLRSRPRVVVGTPGKIFDMFRRQGIDGQTIKTVVIDEADEMFNKGFSEQVYGILQCLHKDVQVCLMSATLPPELESITSKFMRNPVEIRVKADQLTLEGIEQFHIAVENDQSKFDVVVDLFEMFTLSQTIIYCNKTETVEQLYDEMTRTGHAVTFVHGRMDPEDRKENFDQFIYGKHRVLISSDLTARGIDVQQVSTVVNFDFPFDVSTYLHRIGRSGRWGRKGMALNLVSVRDVRQVREVEQYYHTEIPELTAVAIERHRGR